jgi:hypothetical protein
MTKCNDSCLRLLSASILILVLASVGAAPAFAQAVPTGESTAFAGFDAAMTCGFGANCVTLGMWNQTLLPANVNFNGRDVTEQNPVAGGGGSGNDTCHFNGSAVNTFDALTGGNWTVGAGNVWGEDYVGWFLAAVQYYRNRGRAPCGTNFQQRMVINMNVGTMAYGGNNTGNTNTLGGNINVRTVTSSRSGNTRTLNR